MALPRVKNDGGCRQLGMALCATAKPHGGQGVVAKAFGLQHATVHMRCQGQGRAGLPWRSRGDPGMRAQG